MCVIAGTVRRGRFVALVLPRSHVRCSFRRDGQTPGSMDEAGGKFISRDRPQRTTRPAPGERALQVARQRSGPAFSDSPAAADGRDRARHMLFGAQFRRRKPSSCRVLEGQGTEPGNTSGTLCRQQAGSGDGPVFGRRKPPGQELGMRDRCEGRFDPANLLRDWLEHRPALNTHAEQQRLAGLPFLARVCVGIQRLFGVWEQYSRIILVFIRY